MTSEKTVPPARQSRNLLAGPLVLTILAGICAYLYQASTISQRQAGHWISVQHEPLIHTIGLSGKIEPHRTIALTAPFEGTVLANKVDAGQRVEEGQTMLEMDPTLIEIQLRDILSAQLKAQRTMQELRDWATSPQVARARRTVRTAEMSLRNLNQRLDDSQQLLARGIIARNELDDLSQQTQMQQLEWAAAHSELQQVLSQGTGENLTIAEIELKNATVKLEGLRLLLDGRSIRAPFTGVVVPLTPAQQPGASPATPIQAGALVSQGQVLFGLADIERLKIVTSVSELDINQLHQGQAVEILGDGFDGERLNGAVDAISRMALTDGDSSGIARFAVTLSIAELTHAQLQRVRLGMSARLTLVTYRNDQAIILTSDALRSHGSDQVVEYRVTMDQPGKHIVVATGRSTLKGVEVFGLQPGYVRLNNQGSP